MFATARDWFRSTFGLAMLGGVLLWAALPPLDLTPLAWIAPAFWILLICAEKLPQCIRHTPCAEKKRHTECTGYIGRPWLLLCAVLLFATWMVVLEWFHAMRYEYFWVADTIFWLALIALFLWAARRWAAHPYRSLFLAGMFFWLAALQWIRLPYWAIGFGWLALGIYFGLYLPVFVAVSRFGVHRLRLPVILVAPVVWTGLELAQAHLLSGMTMGCLEHTQYRWTSLIQISDMTGCYGVTFLMMFVAACLGRILPSTFGRGPGGEGIDNRWTLWPILPAGMALAAALGYGHWRMANAKTLPGLNVALIQGNIDIVLNHSDPQAFLTSIDAQYRSLTREALDRAPQTDLIVWPETVFVCIDRKGYCWRWVTADDNAKPPDDYNDTPEAFRKALADWGQATRNMMTDKAVEFGRPMIVGIDREHYGPRGGAVFNTAALITPDGRWFDRPPDRYFYDKTHLVPFGEYMPFAEYFPWLQYLSPLGSGSSSSDRPACFVVKNSAAKNINMIPSICYETTLPHVIRDQLARLRRDGIEPQILVNVTNDGWFWGSAELEQHLACGVYRAVENRRPLVIAANTGISASIDGDGRILARGPKHDTGFIVADVRLDDRESWYSLHGDRFAGTCLAMTIILAVAGIGTALRRPRRT